MEFCNIYIKRRIMSFITKINLQDNRQHKLPSRKNNILSGSTVFGVPFNDLESGPDLDNVSFIGGANTGVTGTYSGNSNEVVFDLVGYGMNISVVSDPITNVNSGLTHESGQIFNSIGINQETIDGNVIYHNYTGVTLDFNLTTFNGDFNDVYNGDFIVVDADYIEAETLDFTGRTIWSDVKGILKTEDIIISNGTSGATAGYVLTSDSEGKGVWKPSSGGGGSFTGNTSGTCIDDIFVKNIYGCDNIKMFGSVHLNGSDGSGLLSTASGFNSSADGDYSSAKGSGTTSYGIGSSSEGVHSISSGDYSYAAGNNCVSDGFASRSVGFKTVSGGDYSYAKGYSTSSSGLASSSDGVVTFANGEGSHSQGKNTIAEGDYSHAGGVGLGVSINEHVLAGGRGAFAHYSVSGRSIGVLGDYSAILGGVNSGVVSGATNTVVLGGDGIKGVEPNTVYVPDLVIDGLGEANPLMSNIDGKIVAGISDSRLKENINPLSDSIDKINKLRGVSFEYTKDSNMGSGLRYGFIAQEVRDVLPNVVRSRPKGDGMLSLNYTEIIPWLVEGIKDIVNGNITINDRVFKTQTIVSEDNNIELNYGGEHNSAMGGGISVKDGVSYGVDSFIKIDESGRWVVGPSMITPQLTLPEYTPNSTGDSSGDVGDVVWGDEYIFIKTNVGWKRTKLETF